MFELNCGMYSYKVLQSYRGTQLFSGQYAVVEAVGIWLAHIFGKLIGKLKKKNMLKFEARIRCLVLILCVFTGAIEEPIFTPV